MTIAAGTRLGPYEIVSALGAGGMGEVYQARDEKLDRDVAIKVLPAHLTDSPDARARFEREAKAVAALSHPNILAIHDFGTHDGVSYAVMELLDGETLRERLQAPISQKQAVDYALQIVRGLSAAHEKGVVHRDLKPENLFITKDGHVKILDFGLAKRIPVDSGYDETGAPTVSGHTEPGTVMGTVGYMSPEQVRGLAVDHRSDIFSFGAILYEMLSGRKAFRKDTAADTMSAILKEEPPELSESRSALSPALDRVVRHCLEKARERRFQSARDIAFALEDGSSPVVTGPADGAAPGAARSRALIAAVLIAGLAVAGFFLLRLRHEGASQAARVTRMVVLPFENLGSPEDDYFADGIADAVRGKLTSVAGIEVIARGSSISYKKTTKTPKQIADGLDARYLLTATVRWQKSGGSSRVQVSPELVEVKESGAPSSKWQQPFDASLTDVFQVQSEIATRVARALGIALGAGEEKRLTEKPTENLAAYDAFLRGEEAWNGWASGVPNFRKALRYYEQAVAVDPAFADAWWRLSRVSRLLYNYGTPTPELAERARQGAEMAISLAPDRPEGYHQLGWYQQSVLNDATRAEEQYARAIRLSPKNADLLELKAASEVKLGHWEASLELSKQAEHLDPRAVKRKVWVGTSLVRLRRYGEAREVLDRGLVLAPGSLAIIAAKAKTFLGEGDLARARGVIAAAPREVEPTALVAYLADDDLAWVLDERQMDLLLRLTPSEFEDNRGTWAFCLAQAYALRGDRANLRVHAEHAKRIWEEQLRVAPQNALRHALLGLALAYLGQKEEATREGERAVALQPIEKDRFNGPYLQHLLVRTHILVGEPEKALDKLEPLLKVPYVLSPGWLKIDPNFDPLRKNPRFQRLIAGAE